MKSMEWCEVTVRHAPLRYYVVSRDESPPFGQPIRILDAQRDADAVDNDRLIVLYEAV